MPGLVPGIHVLGLRKRKDADGRDKPGHEARYCPAFQRHRQTKIIKPVIAFVPLSMGVDAFGLLLF
jgi:hypothetical protein